MEPILSKEEIEELISALSSGEIDTELEEEGSPLPEDQGVTPTPIDLTQIRHSFKWRIVNFDIILDSFARNFSVTLSRKLQSSVSVKRESVDSYEFRQFMQNVKGTGGIGVFEAYPLKGSGLIFFEKQLCFYLLELLLGSSEEHELVVLDRQLSMIETNLLKSFMRTVCHDFQEAFAQVETIQCDLMNVVIDPRVVNIVSDDTEVMVSHFTVNLGELKGDITLLLPYYSLEPYKDTLKDVFMSPSSKSKSATWTDVMQKNILKMETELAAEFGKVSISIREILNLQEGDILFLNSKENSPLQILVDRKPKFNGIVGLKQGKKAVRILHRIGADENN